MKLRIGGRLVTLSRIRNFFHWEAAGGVVLIVASLAAILVANSPFAEFYGKFLRIPGAVRVGDFEIAKPLLLWVNDGLMAIFFFLVGLEIKRELAEGELSSPSKILLPALAAAAGMAAPAGVFIFVNWGDAAHLSGWAIPSATDIAFALTILSLVRVPLSIKVLLTAIAILDDLGAIVIIAAFYTDQISQASLGWATVALVGLGVLNRFRVTSLTPYVLVGTFLWACVLKSGVHATLAGVMVAAAIPMRGGEGGSPMKRAEHALHPWVAFLVLPLFGFANAGVPLTGLGLDSLLEPVTLGIALGLFLGKQVGILGSVWLAVRLRIASMPQGATWRHVWGAAVLCGIGFTMSLFIGSLAYEHAHFDAPVRLGVLVGSIASAALGIAILKRA
jgi:NhaA family Na+:H+ antiporter